MAVPRPIAVSVLLLTDTTAGLLLVQVAAT